MSRNYDNWEKLVEAVLRREKDRQLALFESFSSSVFSSRPSFDSDVSAGAPSSQSNFVSHIQFVEIALSTKNFHPDTLLGEGRFGPLYKGWIHEHFHTAVKPGSGIAVAIRKLDRRGILSLDRPRHSNLVKLIGYSFDEGNRVLVYQFMPNGSLDNHLFIRGHQPLPWETRMKVAIGAARGLSLFHDLKISVTHENVKSSSILLDDEFNANWSDFYLTTVPVLSHRTSQVRNDYASPEYISTDELTMKSDVYSFGIILLELLCGFRVLDQHRPMKKQNLVVWAKPYLSNKKKLLQIVDSRLEGLCSHDEAYKFGKVAFKCLSLDPKLRPSMTQVLDMLERFGSDHYRQNQTKGQTGIDRLMEPARSSNWSVLGPATSLNHSNGVGTTSVTNSSAGLSQVSAGLSDDGGVINGEILAHPNIKVYSYADLKTAARNFRGDMVLGVGGFGTVYKGWVDGKTLLPSRHGTGMMVAIKKLNQESTQGFDEWQAEVDFLGKLSHPNLVKLLGYCLEDQELLLVYEFMAKGSLENHLFIKNAKTEPLSWELRMRIAIGAAKGLAFLHSSEKQIIYRDFKASNILLDGSYNAKISDFGLAKLGPAGGFSHVTTRIMGTQGYAAPEYIATGHLYVKSDVYGFGVVLLEMLTGLRAVDVRRPGGQQNLVDWLKPTLSQRKKVKTIMDERIEGQYSSKAAIEAAKLTLRCLEPEPRRRPPMEEVVVILNQISAMGRPHRSPAPPRR